jgi:hypothetical protein
MTLPLSIDRNLGGKIKAYTPVLPASVADSFRLYSAAVSTGPFSPIKFFPNAPNPPLYAGSALVSATRAELGYPLPTTAFFLKITSVKGGVESVLAASDLTTVPPEGSENFDTFRESLDQIAQLHGYNEASGKWIRLEADPSGVLQVSAVLNTSGTATEAKQDDIITALTVGPVPIEDLFSLWQVTPVPVTVSTAFDLLGAANGINAALSPRKNILIQNRTGADMFLGDASSAAQTVWWVPQNGQRQIPADTFTPSIFVRAPSGSGSIVVIEFA